MENVDIESLFNEFNGAYNNVEFKLDNYYVPDNMKVTIPVDDKGIMLPFIAANFVKYIDLNLKSLSGVNVEAIRYVMLYCRLNAIRMMKTVDEVNKKEATTIQLANNFVPNAVDVKRYLEFIRANKTLVDQLSVLITGVVFLNIKLTGHHSTENTNELFTRILAASNVTDTLITNNYAYVCKNVLHPFSLGLLKTLSDSLTKKYPRCITIRLNNLPSTYSKIKICKTVLVQLNSILDNNKVKELINKLDSDEKTITKDWASYHPLCTSFGAEKKVIDLGYLEKSLNVVCAYISCLSLENPLRRAKTLNNHKKDNEIAIKMTSISMKAIISKKALGDLDIDGHKERIVQMF